MNTIRVLSSNTFFLFNILLKSSRIRLDFPAGNLLRVTGLNIYLVMVCLLSSIWSMPAQAALVMLSGPQVGTHTGNLVTNGSFEIGAPAPGTANQLNWATGTTLTPFGIPSGWITGGSPDSYAKWGAGNATQPRLLISDILPDGTAGMYFGNGYTNVDMQPTYLTSGEVRVHLNKRHKSLIGF